MPVSVVIPCFNEAEYLSDILKVVSTHKNVDEVIVVDDGSTDDSYKIASTFTSSIISHPKNQGKTSALQSGIEAAKGSYLILLDADLTGLRHEHIDLLLEPLVKIRVDMTMGIYNKTIFEGLTSKKFNQRLTGNRGIVKKSMQKFPWDKIQGYGFEVALNYYAKINDWKILRVSLCQLKHHRKELKLGLMLGFVKRFQMWMEVMYYWFFIRVRRK